MDQSPHEILAFFHEEGFPPVQASDNGVSVTMNASFAVTAVTITGVDIARSQLDQLQEATVRAFNEAMRRVAELNAERLQQALPN